MLNLQIGIIKTKQVSKVTSQLGLHEIANEPTHILPNSSSCIDLIFTSQPNMVIEPGIHSSLHSSCDHQIVFAKFSLKIFYSPYSREVTHHIKRSLAFQRSEN